MKTKSKSPNILLIMVDQLAPQFLPCYGHPVVKSPNIDRLARDGVVFQNAYTNSPLCAPSRFVMMSGRLPSKISAWDNAAEFSSEIPTFAHYLTAEGYRTSLSGKMHFVGPDQLHGFQDRLTTDVYPSDFTWHPEWDNPGKRLDWFHNMEVVTKAGSCVRSMYLDYDDEVLFNAKRYIFDHVREDYDEPFMLTVSMIQPHDPYLCSKDKWELYSGDDIDLPITSLDSIEEDSHSARLRHSYGASDDIFDDETIQRARRSYYGSISDIDDKVGELINTLNEAGASDNTIVIFTSDHGDMLGERGMWFKMSFFEHSARVPLIINAPKMFSSKQVQEAVSLVDMLPTLVEIARDGKEGDYATDIDGRSLLPHISGNQGHDEVIGEYFGEGISEPMHMIRCGSKKLIYSKSDPVQYYDLINDPHEINNIANNAAHKTEINKLITSLSSNYNYSELCKKVLESQSRRNFLKGVMSKHNIAWDYYPSRDSSKEYVRNNMPIYELEKRARFPKV